MGKNVTHLYRGFRPAHYELNISPDRDSMLLSGTAVITGKKVGRPSQRLTFHQKGLTITSAEVIWHDKKGDQEIAVKRINNQESFDEVRLHAEHTLYPGNYTITMHYEGKITRPMEGVYPCYFDDNGTAKQLIATQFESHHAREAFPCIDEPEAKATFGLTLTSPKGETALANSPIKSKTEKGKSQITVFEPTPKMSTYLVAFAYGELGHKQATTKDGVKVTAYATPENTEFVDFALDVAVKTLEFYNDYFAIPYPLPKCDLIALPDFASGAMENWGLITFREQCMLVDPANTSLSNKQFVAMVVAHELAHMWFGNLVTMRWWTDLWLNEGFASWIEYLATDYNFPDWDMWTQFIVDEQEQGLRLDALEHTHPIEVPIHHPDEIRTIFDAISYSKGSSVIHMLRDYLGADIFRDGLRFYLQQHAYSNTDTVDLWAALEQISGKPVREFMHAWTSQAGYPIVKAEIDNMTATLSQERFQLNPTASQDNALWPVPLLTGDLLNDPKTFSKASQTLNLKLENSHAMLNRGSSGFYRTTYNPTHLIRLGESIRTGKLTPLERVKLLSDQVEAAKAGYVGAEDVLTLLESYRGEDNSVVWDIMASLFGSIRMVMKDDQLRESMKPFILELINKQLTRLGWQAKKGEPHFDTLLRPTILSLAASADEPDVLVEIDKRFNNLKKSADIEPDLRGVVYGTVARRGDCKEFDILLGLYSKSKNSEERVVLAAALTGFKQPELTKKALGLIMTDAVRLQDAGYWIAYSFSNRHGRDIAWHWMNDNWQWIEDNLGNDLSFYRMPIYAGRCYSDSEFLPTFKAFFEPKATPALQRSINQAVEIIQWQSAWRQRDLKSLKAFFKP